METPGRSHSTRRGSLTPAELHRLGDKTHLIAKQDSDTLTLFVRQTMSFIRGLFKIGKLSITITMVMHVE